MNNVEFECYLLNNIKLPFNYPLNDINLTNHLYVNIKTQLFGTSFNELFSDLNNDIANDLNLIYRL